MERLSTFDLKTPVGTDGVKQLKIGDLVYLSGEIVTMRDSAHKRALEDGVPVNLKNGAIYHCGPLVDGMVIVAAGPTTSARMNPVTPKIISKFGISLIIGKGGMDDKALESMRGRCAYLSFAGGCGVLAAGSLEVKKVFWRDLGDPEALWVMNAKRFGPLLVSMDSRGNGIYGKVEELAEKNFERLEKWD